MLNMDPISLRTALSQMEQATRDHVVWHENLLRTIVCGLPFNPNELGKDAHLNCPFGRWYYEQAPPGLWGQPVFAAIGRKHEHLHRTAARLLRDVAADVPVVRKDFDDLLAGLGELRRTLDLLRDEIANTLRNRDVLTGAYDRAEMLPRLQEWHELAKRHVQPCCIAFMDLDRFKDVNDRYGHGTGDEVLASVIRHLGRCLRPFDKVFRYGGDEFLICLPGSDLAIGQAVIKRVRESLASHPQSLGREAISLQVTASFGIALLDPEVGVEDSIERADQALLLAKTAGRSRAISWDPGVTTGTRLPVLRIEDMPE